MFHVNDLVGIPDADDDAAAGPLRQEGDDHART
jgi:hypothetical protein